MRASSVKPEPVSSPPEVLQEEAGTEGLVSILVTTYALLFATGLAFPRNAQICSVSIGLSLNVKHTSVVVATCQWQ